MGLSVGTASLQDSVLAPSRRHTNFAWMCRNRSFVDIHPHSYTFPQGTGVHEMIVDGSRAAIDEPRTVTRATPGKASFEFTDVAVQTSVGTEMDALCPPLPGLGDIASLEIDSLIFEHASRH
jgi:hypothetical protein